MRASAVLFDLDGTLLDRRATFRHHLECQIERWPGIFSDAHADRYVTELLALDENGTLDRDEFYRSAEERFGFPTGAARELRADFEAHFPERCFPFPGLASTLRALAAAGLRLGLVTNGRVLIQSRKIDGLGIRDFFESVVISEAAGFRKPDRRIFEIASTELGVPPEAAAFVGDHPVADMEGARRAGLIPIWKRDDFWPEPDDVEGIVEELADVPDVLSRLQGARRVIEEPGRS